MEVPTVYSVLDAVTVYAQGAVCTRLARVKVEGGALPRSLRFAGLPLTLKEGSLRARVLSGPAGLSVTDVRAGFDAELPPEVDVPLEQQALELARDQAGRLELELSHAQREAASVAALRPVFLPRKKGEAPRDAPVSSILELSAFVDQELRRLDARRLELERALVDARNELELRRARLSEASSSKRTERARLTRAAVVTLTGQSPAGEAELALEYLVPSARWTPGYDLRLDASMAAGTLRMRASIAQRTGEDWKNVRLAISTADLDRRTDAPELKSLRVGRSQPPPARSGWREAPPGLDELFAGYDEALRRRPVSARPEGRPQASSPPGQAQPSAVFADELRRADSTSHKDKARAGGGRAANLSPPPPPRPAAPAPAAASAPSRAMAPPAAAPMQAQAKSTSALRSEESAAPMRRRMSAPTMDFAAPDEADEMSQSLDEDTFGGLHAPAPQEAPELALGGDLLDYDLLAMPEGDRGSERGRLSPRRDPLRGLLVAASATVHVEVLVAAFSAERQKCFAVDGLAAPPFAVPLRESAGSYDYRYDADHRVDLDGDGAWHTVPIGAAEVSLAPRYVCVPSMENRVYRTLSVQNRSALALLGGAADVTLGNEFLMTVPFPPVAPHGEAQVGLGVEEAIKVSRNTKFNETTGGLLGGSSVLAHEVSIEVANRLAHPALVEVRERVPVPEDDDIKVDESQVDPPWKPDDKVRGQEAVLGARSWQVTLAAGAKAALSARYVIKLPSGKVLVGGNRRV
jgi:hypothetical protein